MKSQSATISTHDRLIVALDVSTAAEARALAAKLAPEISRFKIGLQLFTAAGPEIIRALSANGAKIFLDLKLHDIPNTVAKAVEAAATQGVEMLTIHLSGGRAMIEAAVAAKGSLHLLGVTVLTSANAETLRETGINSSPNDQVLRLAQLGHDAGIDGLITSPHEVKTLREKHGDKMKIITPGVRPAWASADDQKRFMTPREAIENGADFLVIGRPITAHRDPRQAVEKILREIEA